MEQRKKDVTTFSCTPYILKFKEQLITIFCLLFFVSISVCAYGQKLPISESIVYKQLSNGFSYYVIPDENPGKVELYLLSNTGTMVEQPQDRGIAHFLEHMVFKGSKNFPGGKTIDALENMGLRVGQDYNGSVDKTYSEYTITIPDNNIDKLSQSLSLLKDWAFDLTMDEADFKVEQKVVIEEIKQRGGKNVFPYYKGTILEGHNGLGDQELINSFTSQRVLDFYKKHYTPDQLALVVLGKVNIKEVEKLIKKKFGKAPKYNNSIINKYPDLASETVISGDYTSSSERDKAPVVSMGFKYNITPIDTYQAFKDNMVISIFTSMLENRLNRTENSSLTNVGINHSTIVPGTAMFTLRLRGEKESMYIDLFKDFCSVMASIKTYGFLEEEIQNATKSLVDRYENSKEELFPSTYQAMRHLIDGDTPLSGKDRYELAQQLANEINIEDFTDMFNSFLSYHKTILFDNTSTAYHTDFTDTFILDQLKNIDQLTVEPFKYVKPQEKFMRKQISSATVQIDTKTPVKVQEKIEMGDYLYLLKYANGINVVVNSSPKATTQVKMVSNQGLNIIPEADRTLMKLASPSFNNTFGTYSSAEANSLLRELNIYKDVKLKNYGYELGLRSEPENIESILKVFNLLIDEEQLPDMESFIKALKAKKVNVSSEDEYDNFVDEVLGKALAFPAFNPSVVNESDVERLFNYNLMLNSNLHQAYVYVGGANLPKNIDELISTYVATINPNPEQKSNNVLNVNPQIEEPVLKQFSWRSSGTKVEYLFTDVSKPISFKDKLIVEAIAEYGYKRLFEVLRMKYGFIYSMGTTGSSNKAKELSALSFRYITAEQKNLEASYDAIENEILAPISKGMLTDDDVLKMKALVENRYLTSFYDENRITGVYLDSALEYGKLYTRDEIQKLIRDISAKDIKKMGKKIVRLDRYYKILKERKD